METEHKPVIGQQSAESIIIERRLRKMSEGETVTYDELNSLIPGADVQGDQRSYLTTAMRRCVADSIFIRVTAKVGVTRLTDKEEAGMWRHQTDKMRRATRRAAQRLARIQDEKLDAAHKRELFLGLSITGTLAFFLKPAKIVELEDKVSTKALPVAETINFFNK